jgi:hypothetical protein
MCIWDTYERDVADAKLSRILLWVGANAVPDRVFPAAALDKWAMENGYVRKGTR